MIGWKNKLILSFGLLSYVNFVFGSCNGDKHPIYAKPLKSDCNFLPSEWSQISDYCTDSVNNRQSPVVLDTRKCPKGQVKSLHFGGNFFFDNEYNFINTRLYVSFTPIAELTVTGGNLIGVFVVNSFHFHWGTGDPFYSEGSEHRIVDYRGLEYPSSLEMHIVMVKKGLSFEEAKKTKDNVAVISILFQSKDLQPDYRPRENRLAELALATIGRQLHLVKDPRQNKIGKITLKLMDFIPEDFPLNFINYDGSLTTPDCNPVVQWHLIYPPLSVNPYLIQQFTQLTYNGTLKIENNYRPTLGLNDRKLRCF